MPTFSIISPMDQPLGKRRLLDDLKKYLQDKKLNEFGFSVAFAKAGPLYRLEELLLAWRKEGKRTSVIFGIDHNGTSRQALEFALKHFDEVFYTQYRGHSFHPKIYWFQGKTKGIAIIGSNNMTVGGTELNFEAAVELTFKLPDEQADFDRAHIAYAGLLPASCVATFPLTKEAIAQLDAEGLLLDETAKAGGPGGTAKGRKVSSISSRAPKLPVRPASSLPANMFSKIPPKKKDLVAKAEILQAQAKKVDISKPLVPVAGFAIQIKPHDNGEIFLSRTAAQQNPAFFGMPFTGKTTPKKSSTNPAYPQRSPDPICNITVFGAKNKVLKSLQNYALNTVFYETKSEIRITASPLVEHVPEYSVMVMMLADEPGVDYEMQIFTPQSPEYTGWESICNQSMPSGGKAPRKFGWF